MEFLTLLGKTLLFRSYVFVFLGMALGVALSLMGRTRTVAFFLITWIVAFGCEFSSTRTGIPFGWYVYNESTRGQELYLSNVPVMDSLSFTYLLFGSYCLSLLFLSPNRRQGSQIYIASTALRHRRPMKTGVPNASVRPLRPNGRSFPRCGKWAYALPTRRPWERPCSTPAPHGG